jgi:hypothetical protein
MVAAPSDPTPQLEATNSRFGCFLQDSGRRKHGSIEEF